MQFCTHDACLRTYGTAFTAINQDLTRSKAALQPVAWYHDTAGASPDSLSESQRQRIWGFGRWSVISAAQAGNAGPPRH